MSIWLQIGAVGEGVGPDWKMPRPKTFLLFRAACLVIRLHIVRPLETSSGFFVFSSSQLEAEEACPVTCGHMIDSGPQEQLRRIICRVCPGTTSVPCPGSVLTS